MGFEETELPWPQPGDEVFAEAADWQMNACLNWGGGLMYALGYRTGADALIERVAETGMDQDALVYPIVFCYRQYLELLLKDVIVEARKYYDVDEPVRQTHPLHPLWQDLRPLLERRWPDDSRELDAVEDALRQFDAVDRQSFAFRYPRTKKGDPSLPRDMLRINLRNLAEVVARVGTYLEACNDALHEERHAADYESEADYGIGPGDF